MLSALSKVCKDRSAIAMIPLNYEPTIANIKAACKRFFKAKDMECDILASKRGPSWTETSQISNWKSLHVQFIERSEKSQMYEKVEIKETKSELTPQQPFRPMSTRIVASVPLSAMLKVGKFIQPTFRTFRDAYLATALCKLGPGKFVLKKLRKIKFKK